MIYLLQQFEFKQFENIMLTQRLVVGMFYSIRVIYSIIRLFFHISAYFRQDALNFLIKFSHFYHLSMPLKLIISLIY